MLKIAKESNLVNKLAEVAEWFTRVKVLEETYNDLGEARNGS